MSTPNTAQADQLTVIDRGQGWTVEAEWFGATRVIYRGTVHECIGYRREVETDQAAA